MVKKTWRERIEEAKKRGYFTLQDERDAVLSWYTCAVGERRATLPLVVKFRSEQPIDPVLIDLGNSRDGFGAAVLRQDITKAERLLDAIEDRVLQLKREGGA